MTHYLDCNRLHEVMQAVTFNSRHSFHYCYKMQRLTTTNYPRLCTPYLLLAQSIPMKKHPQKDRNKVATLEDVARQAEVSTATVSRSLNFPDQVLGETRKRVMRAIQQLEYTPNFNARSLAAKQTSTVGAIIPTMENAIFARGIQAFQEELRLHGMTLLVASSSYNNDLEEEQIRSLVARGADALLLIGHKRKQAIYNFLKQRGVHVLVAWAHNTKKKQASIGFDNTESMAALAEEVIARGHRRIAFISAHRASNDRAHERVVGVQTAMTTHGLDPQDIIIIETSYSIKSGRTAFACIMATDNKPTVVMCGNDVLATGALIEAKHMKLHVPKNISITGFDDIELARVVDPALTTVHVPHRTMGRLAARQLVDMIKGHAGNTQVKLDTTLQLRQTLGRIKET